MVEWYTLTLYFSPLGGQYFILDFNFPKRLIELRYNYTVNFIQFLFKKYLQYSLTNKSNRDTVISSLVKYIKSTLRTEGRYGVFRYFFSRLLL